MDDAIYTDPMQPADQPTTYQPAETGETDVVGVPLNQVIDLEIAQMVTSRQKASEQWRQPYRLEWDKATDHYEQKYDDAGKESWQAKTFQPMTTTLVERATASLHNMHMGPETPVEYQARSTQNEEIVDKTNEIVQHDLEHSEFKVHWTDFIRTLSLYGTAIGEVGYDKEEATVMVKERKKPMLGGMMQQLLSALGMGGAEEQETFTPKKMLVKDFATFKNCDLYQIYPQPFTEDITKDTWIIKKDKIKNRELVEGARNPDPYYRLENVTPELLTSGASPRSNDPETQQRDATLLHYDIPMPFLDPDLEHERLQYWGPVPKWYLAPDTRSDDSTRYDVDYAWIWVIDGRWVVRKKPTPFIDATPPFVKGNYIRRLGQFYGVGIGKLVDGLQIEKNEIRNTRQDNIELILQKVMAFNKDKVSKEDMARLVSGPGALWPFSGTDDIRKVLMPVEIGDVTGDSWRASAEVDREAQEVVDIVKTTQTIGAGEDQAGNGTFRGQMLNKQQQNERSMLYARILETTGLNAAIKKIYGRIYQFKKYEQIAAILGEERAKDFELVPCEKLSEIARMVSLGALSTQNKGVMLAEMREFYMVAGQEMFFKKIDYLRKWYRLMGAGSDPDEVLMSDEEIQMLNEQRRLMYQKSMMTGQPPEPGMQPMTDDGLPMPNAGPVAGDTPPPMGGMPRPAMEAQGPGASPMDMSGRPM